MEGDLTDLTDVGVAAMKLALTMGPGHRIVSILCDSGTRHLSKFWAEVGNINGKEDMTLQELMEAFKD